MHRTASLLVLLVIGGTASVLGQPPSWIDHNGPFASGRVLAVHPSSALLSTAEGYIVISWDDGRTWRRQSNAPFVPFQLEVLPDRSLVALSADGVFHSSDLGQTWTSNGTTPEFLWHLAIDPAGPWYAASNLALFVTMDQGGTWSPLPFEIEPNTGRFIDLLVTANHAVLATVGDLMYYGARMYRSEDGGQTWETVPSGCCTIGGPLVLNEDGSLLLASYDPEGNLPGIPMDGLIQSTDDGVTWTRIQEGPRTGALQSRVYGLVAATPYQLMVLGSELRASGVNRFIDTASGTLIANSSDYYYGFKEGEETTNGTGAYAFQPWRDMEEWYQIGTEKARVTDLAFVDDELVVGTDRALHRSLETGWGATGVNNGIAALEVLPDDRLLVSTDNGYGINTYGSDDSFVFYCTWGCFVSAITAEAETVLASIDESWFSAEAIGINRTSDNGKTWVTTLAQVGDVRVLEAAGEGVYYAGTSGVAIYGEEGVGVYRSLDDGITWTPFIDGLANTEVHALWADRGTVLAGTEGGVFRSQDGGPWHRLGLDARTVYALAQTRDGFIAGTDQGAYRYDGMAWDEWGDALGERVVTALHVVQNDQGDFLVAGTDRGVFVDRPGLLTTGLDPVAVSLVEHRVDVYPNPTSSTLRIQFAVPAPQQVDIVLYDVLGRHVAEQARGAQAVGVQAVTWSIDGIPSGSYLLVIQTEHERWTHPVTIIR